MKWLFKWLFKWLITPTIRIDRIHLDDTGFRRSFVKPDLVEDIRKHGMLNPITIDENNRVLDGSFRLKAAGWLGWTRVPYKRVIYFPHPTMTYIEDDDCE